MHLYKIEFSSRLKHDSQEFPARVEKKENKKKNTKQIWEKWRKKIKVWNTQQNSKK